MTNIPHEASGAPLENTAVVEAMRNVSVHDSPETRALLFRLLLETTLLVISPTGPESSREWTAKAGETMSWLTLEEEEGSVIPVFTSTDSLLRWRPQGAGYIALPSQALFEMAAAAGTNKVALDPGSPTSGLLTRYEIEVLARKRLPLGTTDVVTEDTQIRIGRPTTPPSELALNALRQSLTEEPLSMRAWYFLMQQGAGTPELFVAIQFQDDAGDDTLERAMRTVIDGAGGRVDEVKALAFIRADGRWQASMEGGSGTEFFRR